MNTRPERINMPVPVTRSSGGSVIGFVIVAVLVIGIGYAFKGGHFTLTDHDSSKGSGTTLTDIIKAPVTLVPEAAPAPLPLS